jgi:hypothetical protein
MAKFPVFYKPRPYQAELHQMWRDNRIGCAVLPRQSGKDVAMSMEMIERRLKVPKTTGTYISLDNPMIRDILWDKTYLDPVTGEYIRMLQDNVPEGHVQWLNTLMVGSFTNHSRLKLQGYFQNGRDKNGVGTSFQDYAFTELALFTREDPLPRLMPIITSGSEGEQKRLMVASTPRGRRNNPLWQLMESFKGDKDFKCIIWTIDDLNDMMKREGLPPVRSQEQLEKDRDSYMKRFGNDRMFEQEYYVSFDEMDAAAVYGEAYMKLLADERTYDFNLNPGYPVYVAFDIGASGLHSDATAWIAFQYINGRLWLYDCGEGHGKALPEYVDVLREKHWFSQIAQIILPWDGDHHEKAVNTTPADMMRKKFPNVAVLAKSNKVYRIPGSRQGDFDLITDIQQVRLELYNTVIHKTNCDWLLECLENYKYEFNNKMQEWSGKPLHDKYSHMADTLRYAVQSTKELDYFQGDFFDTSPAGGASKSQDYVEDWSAVWRR